jgi:hypothetical protein
MKVGLWVLRLLDLSLLAKGREGERDDVPARSDGTLDRPALYVGKSPQNGPELLTLRFFGVGDRA